MNDHGCSHLDNFKAAKGTRPYRIIHSYFVACSSAESRKRKAFSCHCYVCKSFGPRLHSCLHCVFFGCLAGGHMKEHARLKKHFLAVELVYGMVMCFQCGDYVYDREFSVIAREKSAKGSRVLGLPMSFRSWEPGIHDIDLLQLNPRRRKILENTIIGLRGLINLGNTCFMNCIVQALTHTPVLRDYFLAEKHHCQYREKTGCCIVCEVSRLFQEFYSGKKTPLNLQILLHLIWTHARHLAGYEQQDAHEFFIATLDVLHTYCKSASSDPHNCNCIVDQIFTGFLQSDVVCQACNSVSTTIDPFWDISLDLGPAAAVAARTNTKSNGKNHSEEPTSLLDCLERYTRAEHSEAEEKFECSNCESHQVFTKQLTMKKLPVVATFHLKRIDFIRSKKISTFIAFPEHLDMAPYMSHYRNNYNNNTSVTSNGHFNNLLADNRYSLFAVINHSGSSVGGHYTAFIRQQRNHWFKCDDHLITKANRKDVLDSEGYLLFYHKQFLEYE